MISCTDMVSGKAVEQGADKSLCSHLLFAQMQALMQQAQEAAAKAEAAKEKEAAARALRAKAAAPATLRGARLNISSQAPVAGNVLSAAAARAALVSDGSKSLLSGIAELCADMPLACAAAECAACRERECVTACLGWVEPRLCPHLLPEGTAELSSTLWHQDKVLERRVCVASLQEKLQATPVFKGEDGQSDMSNMARNGSGGGGSAKAAQKRPGLFLPPTIHLHRTLTGGSQPGSARCLCFVPCVMSKFLIACTSPMGTVWCGLTAPCNHLFAAQRGACMRSMRTVLLRTCQCTGGLTLYGDALQLLFCKHMHLRAALSRSRVTL